MLNKMKGYLFDLDGCLYFGDMPAPGAAELLSKLRAAGKKVAFVTNNSRQGAEEVRDKLERMGISAFREEIVTATEYAGRFIRDRYGTVTATVVGSDLLQASVEAEGHRSLALDCDEPLDVVLVGRDTEFTYDKLSAIIRHAENGTRIIATNPDLFHPGAGGGKVPETGALTVSAEAVIGAGEIEYVGKPAPYMLQQGMRICGVRADECVMIGDNYSTDILGGMNAGMRTLWVAGDASSQLSTRRAPGAEAATEAVFDRRPDWVVGRISDIVSLLEE